MNKKIRKTRNENMYKAILTLETVEEVMHFFDDLCTVSELQAMEQRFQVAVLLNEGLIYNDILERTGASSATISRVNRSLQYGAGGYALAFERLGIPGPEEKWARTARWHSGTTGSPPTCRMTCWRTFLKKNCIGRDGKT